MKGGGVSSGMRRGEDFWPKSGGLDSVYKWRVSSRDLNKSGSAWRVAGAADKPGLGQEARLSWSLDQ